MADPIRPDNPLTSALDIDTPRVREVVDQVKQRVRERARERTRQAARREIGLPPRSGRTGPAAPLSRIHPLPIPEQSRDRPLAIRLSNGRQINAVVSPGVARRSDLAAIARVSAENNRRALAALEAQNAALESLRRSHERLTQKIATLEKRADEAVLAITDTVGQSSRQLKRLAVQGEKALARAGSAATTAVRTLAVTQQAQTLTNVIGTAQATAYGERGSVLAPNNLLLTGNQLLWTFLGPASTALGASAATATVLAALAPLGSLLTGFAAVGSRVSDRKQERFISGVAVFDMSKSEHVESLRSRIDDDIWELFKRRSDVPVTVNSLDDIAPAQVSGVVINGELHIRIGLLFTGRLGSLPIGRFRIAWMVDTGQSSG